MAEFLNAIPQNSSFLIFCRLCAISNTFANFDFALKHFQRSHTNDYTESETGN
jgi:hypothetical protein